MNFDNVYDIISRRWKKIIFVIVTLNIWGDSSLKLKIQIVESAVSVTRLSYISVLRISMILALQNLKPYLDDKYEK